MKNTGSSVFINTVVTKQFPNGPKVSVEFQIIVALNKNNEWGVDCCDAMDITEIEMFGETITEREKLEKIISNFSEMGIDVWDKMEIDLNEGIADCGGVVHFVKEQTGIILPSSNNNVVGITSPNNNVVGTTDYAKIMADLKQQFGSLGYYNDKRKTFRRIKIYSGPGGEIQQYMKKNYPHIETYYNDDYPWSWPGLCFRLPL
jgi:hypothetical protein